MLLKSAQRLIRHAKGYLINPPSQVLRGRLMRFPHAPGAVCQPAPMVGNRAPLRAFEIRHERARRSIGLAAYGQTRAAVAIQAVMQLQWHYLLRHARMRHCPNAVDQPGLDRSIALPAIQRQRAVRCGIPASPNTDCSRSCSSCPVCVTTRSSRCRCIQNRYSAENEIRLVLRL